VAGGFSNIASGGGAFVGGGGNNGATATNATVGGGEWNAASGDSSTVVGGSGNVAAGVYSLAAGRRAKANHPGAFVWGDSTNADVVSTANDQFVVRASGGISVTAGTGIWRLEPNSTSPNLIGGHSGNAVLAGVVGATIGGGGTNGFANGVVDNYGTVGGGRSNGAGNSDGDPTSAAYATVGGGAGNLANGESSMVGGGSGNSASGNYATVVGGQMNAASGPNSSVGGGQLNSASGDWAVVGGGFTNAALAQGATTGGGENNTANAIYDTVSGGHWNFASAGWATVGGGKGNLASASFATVPGGMDAVASLHGQMAYASGGFSAGGDAQTSVYVLRNVTTDATPTPLYLDGSAERLTVATGRTLTFDIVLVARSTAAASAGYRIQGVIENNVATTGFIGAPTITTLGEDVAAWNVTVLADDANDALVVQAIGAAGSTIRWVATARTAEVAW
jgi:hypothetical protein